MTSSEQAYKYIEKMISEADSYFAMKCVDFCVDHYSKCFTELKMQKKDLIDKRFDKWHELFTKPNIQIKNQNNDHPSTT